MPANGDTYTFWNGSNFVNLGSAYVNFLGGRDDIQTLELLYVDPVLAPYILGTFDLGGGALRLLHPELGRLLRPNPRPASSLRGCVLHDLLRA